MTCDLLFFSFWFLSSIFVYVSPFFLCCFLYFEMSCDYNEYEEDLFYMFLCFGFILRCLLCNGLFSWICFIQFKGYDKSTQQTNGYSVVVLLCFCNVTKIK
eukprot:161751_1